MNTIVIVGGSREAAREELKARTNGARIKKRRWYDEATLDDHRYLAMGGGEEDVCWLRGLGFHIERIIAVEPNGISKEMGKRINHVRSTIKWQQERER